MAFDYDINKVLNRYLQTSFADYKYIVSAGQIVYLEGHTGIVSFTSSSITFRLKKNLLTISGTDLCIAEFDKTSAVVKGQIEGVAVR